MSTDTPAPAAELKPTWVVASLSGAGVALLAAAWVSWSTWNAPLPRPEGPLPAASPAKSAPVASASAHGSDAGDLDDVGFEVDGLKEEVVHSIILAMEPRVHGCWAESKADAGTAGRIGLRVSIGVDGKATSFDKTKDTVGDPSLGACLIMELRKADFLQAVQSKEGTLTLTYDFE